MTTTTTNQNQNPAYVGVIIAWGITETVKAITPLIIMAFQKAKQYIISEVLPAIKDFISKEFPEYIDHINQAMPTLKKLQAVWLPRYFAAIDFTIDLVINIKDAAMPIWFNLTAKVQETINK
jgi:hypothetical protein